VWYPGNHDPARMKMAIDAGTSAQNCGGAILGPSRVSRPIIW
jgi:hypothetical protein